MTNRLTLDWEKATKGYEIVEFDPTEVDWIPSREGEDDWKIFPPDNLPPRMAKLLEKWGLQLEPALDDRYKPFRLIEPIGKGVMKFDPMQSSPSMYVEFANIPKTDDGLISFADRFGLLQEGQPAQPEYWFFQIDRMKTAIAMWEKAGDGSKVEKSFYRGWKHAHISMSFNLKDSGESSPVVTLEPSNLLEAMWVQFGLAVEGLVGFKRCLECSNFIEIQPGTSRPDRRYCTDACRMRAYRKRKSNAK